MGLILMSSIVSQSGPPSYPGMEIFDLVQIQSKVYQSRVATVANNRVPAGVAAQSVIHLHLHSSHSDVGVFICDSRGPFLSKQNFTNPRDIVFGAMAFSEW